MRGFRGCEQIEHTCNNHRAVSMKYGHPFTLRRFKNYDWTEVFYNDAEFMESVCASHNACAFSHVHALTTAPAERCILCVLQETVIFSDDNDNVPNRGSHNACILPYACAFNALAERCMV